MNNEELNEQKGTVTYQLPNLLPPLLAELQQMYSQILKLAVMTVVGDFLGLIGGFFFSLALFSWELIFCRIGGIIILLFAIRSGVAGIMNIKQVLKERKFIEQFNTNPALASWKLLNTFADDKESANFFHSLHKLQRMNRAFGMSSDNYDNYVEKYKFIQAFVLENKEQLSTISSAYSQHAPVITTTPENISILANSFSYIPQNIYEKEFRIKLWFYILLFLNIIGLIVSILFASISISNVANNQEYASEV